MRFPPLAGRQRCLKAQRIGIPDEIIGSGRWRFRDR